MILFQLRFFHPLPWSFHYKNSPRYDSSMMMMMMMKMMMIMAGNIN